MRCFDAHSHSPVMDRFNFPCVLPNNTDYKIKGRCHRNNHNNTYIKNTFTKHSATDHYNPQRLEAADICFFLYEKNDYGVQ